MHDIPEFLPNSVFFPLLVLHDALQHVGLLPPSEIAEKNGCQGRKTQRARSTGHVSKMTTGS